jgi:hypothetical protein
MLTVHAFTMEKFCDLVNAYFYLLQDYSQKQYLDITKEIRHFVQDKKNDPQFDEKLGYLISDKLNQAIDLLNELGYNYDHVSWSGHEINHFRGNTFMDLYHHY